MKRSKELEDYLNGLDTDRKAIFHRFNEIVAATHPEVVFGIKYKAPNFMLNDVSLFQLISQKKHLTLYLSKRLVADHRKELGTFVIGKGTVRLLRITDLDLPVFRTILKKSKEYPFEFSKRGDSTK